jgi:hypothetical protein
VPFTPYPAQRAPSPRSRGEGLCEGVQMNALILPLTRIA